MITAFDKFDTLRDIHEKISAETGIGRGEDGRFHQSHFFDAERLNIFSRVKPVRAPKDMYLGEIQLNIGDMQRMNSNYGMKILATTLSELRKEDALRRWEYEISMGSDDGDYCRIRDFDGYDHRARRRWIEIIPPYRDRFDNGDRYLYKNDRMGVQYAEDGGNDSTSLRFGDLQITGASSTTPMKEGFLGWHIVFLYTLADNSATTYLLDPDVANPHLLNTGRVLSENGPEMSGIEAMMPESFVVGSRWRVVAVLTDNVDNMPEGEIVAYDENRHSARVIPLQMGASDESRDRVEQVYRIIDEPPTIDPLPLEVTSYGASIDGRTDSDYWILDDFYLYYRNYNYDSSKLKVRLTFFPDNMDLNHNAGAFYTRIEYMGESPARLSDLEERPKWEKYTLESQNKSMLRIDVEMPLDSGKYVHLVDISPVSVI